MRDLYTKNSDKGGEGVQNLENLADVIYEWPHNSLFPKSDFHGVSPIFSGFLRTYCIYSWGKRSAHPGWLDQVRKYHSNMGVLFSCCDPFKNDTINGVLL